MKRLSILCAALIAAVLSSAACDSDPTAVPEPPPGSSEDGAWFCCPELKPSDDCVLAVDTCTNKLLWCEEVQTGDDGTKSCAKWSE